MKTTQQKNVTKRNTKATTNAAASEMQINGTLSDWLIIA